MTYPPHLPAPSCNIATHRKWQRVKILLAVTVFCLISGLSGAAIMLGWIWPGWGGGEDWVIARVNNSWLTRTQLEERVRLEMVDRIAVVYARLNTSFGVNYFSADDRLGEAIVVTSDGWLVMNYTGSISNYRSWQVLLNGEVFKLSNVLSDPNSGLVYLKLTENKQVVGREGVQFKIVSFENGFSHIGDEVYVLQNGEWQYAIVKQILTQAESLPHLDSAPITRYVLNINVEPGQIVIDRTGKVLGITGKNDLVLPARYIARNLNGVLEKKMIFYPSLGLEGWFDSERVIVSGTEVLSGFFVVKGNGSIKAGDIILEINGQVVNEDVLWYIISNPSVARFKIMRAGKIMEIELKKKI